MARHFVVTADGGSRGNPGAAAYGAVVYENDKVVKEIGASIGEASNNVAEYSGLIAGLKAVNEIDHAVGLYDHLLAGTGNVDLVETKLTNDINSYFIGGYSISCQTPLNRFMIDYDITRILKEYVGYTSWDEVPMTERGYCFRGYNAKTVLPEWDVEEEKYNN